MKRLIKKFVSQRLVNKFWHLPKAILANIWYGFPSRKLIVIGVTGTDGKTTTTNMIYQILKSAGKKVSMVSTINAVIGGRFYDTGFHVTSPNPLAIQKFAKQAIDNNDEYLVLEVTSHALDQYRFWAVKFNVGVITNITHEHLDYHKNFKNYFETKLKLLKNTKFAVVNHSVREIRGIEGASGGRVTFGLNKGDYNQKEIQLKLKIMGDYNIENALAALAVANTLGINKYDAKKTVEDFINLKGRMEGVENKQGIKIFIDFAHTPNALEQALKTLRSQTTSGRLIAVFGAASERDIQKRPMMGKISAKLADITIITDEDPRFESSNKIIDEIVRGAYQEGVKDGISLFKEANRQKAIRLAISLAKKGDTVGIFGKGHEKSMNYKGMEKPWSDMEAVKKALNG